MMIGDVAFALVRCFQLLQRMLYRTCCPLLYAWFAVLLLRRKTHVIRHGAGNSGQTDRPVQPGGTGQVAHLRWLVPDEAIESFIPKRPRYTKRLGAQWHSCVTLYPGLRDEHPLRKGFVAGSVPGFQYPLTRSKYVFDWSAVFFEFLDCWSGRNRARNRAGVCADRCLNGLVMSSIESQGQQSSNTWSIIEVSRVMQVCGAK